MSERTWEFDGAVEIVVHKPSPNRVFNTGDKDAPLLKRRAPRRPPLNPEPAPPKDKQDAESE